MSKKDTLFSKDTSKSSFKFDSSVAEVFDDMAKRSIINYQQTLELTSQTACDFAQQNSTIYDLGCSTGNTLLAIASKLKKPNINLIGYDLSSSMIDKCREKLNQYIFKNIAVKQADCSSADLQNASVVIMNYTLQFIKKEQREKLLKNIYANLNDKGAFILSEKVGEESEILTNFSTQKYYQIKEKNGYSALEIANKRNALEKVLEPNSYFANYQFLKNAGFTKIMTLTKTLNFTTYLAVK